MNVSKEILEYEILSFLYDEELYELNLVSKEFNEIIKKKNLPIVILKKSNSGIWIYRFCLDNIVYISGSVLFNEFGRILNKEIARNNFGGYRMVNNISQYSSEVVVYGCPWSYLVTAVSKKMKVYEVYNPFQYQKRDDRCTLEYRGLTTNRITGEYKEICFDSDSFDKVKYINIGDFVSILLNGAIISVQVSGKL